MPAPRCRSCPPLSVALAVDFLKLAPAALGPSPSSPSTSSLPALTRFPGHTQFALFPTPALKSPFPQSPWALSGEKGIQTWRPGHRVCPAGARTSDSRTGGSPHPVPDQRLLSWWLLSCLSPCLSRRLNRELPGKLRLLRGGPTPSVLPSGCLSFHWFVQLFLDLRY